MSQVLLAVTVDRLDRLVEKLMIVRLEEEVCVVLTISDVSAFNDSSTDGLCRSDADVYVFNGDELPENAEQNQKKMIYVLMIL